MTQNQTLAPGTPVTSFIETRPDFGVRQTVEAVAFVQDSNSHLVYRNRDDETNVIGLGWSGQVIERVIPYSEYTYDLANCAADAAQLVLNELQQQIIRRTSGSSDEFVLDLVRQVREAAVCVGDWHRVALAIAENRPLNPAIADRLGIAQESEAA